MPEQSYTPKKYTDFISDFTNGINSGRDPLALDKTELAFAVNVSLRGGFINVRPPFIKRLLSFSGNTAVSQLIATGLFQGGGYYRPDAGTELLLAAISGHLIQFQEQGFGGTWNVTDVSVPGDLNSATQQQAWMWQAEKWMIVNDGSGGLPAFFNGTSSRRSYGPTQVIGTANAANPGTPPPIYVPNPVPPLNSNSSLGNTSNVQADCAVTLTLTAPYTGDFNIPVIFNGEYYMAVQNTGGFEVVLTNLNDTPGNTIPAGTNVVVNPAIAAIGVDDGHGGAGSIIVPTPGSQGTFDVTVDNLTGIAVGAQLSVTFGSNTYGLQVNTVDTTTNDLSGVLVSTTNPAPDFGATIPDGAVIYFQSQTAPSVIIGATTAPYVVPAINGTVNAFISQPYTAATERVTIGGQQYLISPPGGSTGGNQLILVNLSDTSTEAYALPLAINSVPELPAGRMGCYGMGRNWFSLTSGLAYEAGDIVGGGSGTPAYNYRDSVLKTTENDFMTGGGSFTLPGTADVIQAMIFPPVLDTNLGVGSLQIFTPFSVFANNAPADRTTWANLTWPIQTESLKDQGALSQNGTVLVNSDVFFRGDFNFGSLILARRQFQLNQWGNKPISDEMQRVLQLDNPLLLQYGSAVSFDNRFLGTCSPQAGPQGVYHTGLISLNFDLLSSLRDSLPPQWEGAWSGLNILQILKGRVNGMLRCFLFTYNAVAGGIELWELLGEAYATQNEIVADNNATPIVSMFETPIMFGQGVKAFSELIQLRDGEVYLSDIEGVVNVSVYYRPDFYSCWTLWNTFTVCSDMDGFNAQPSYRMRVGLGEPSVTPVEAGNGRPLRLGYFFQFRFVVQGQCTVNGMRASATTFADPVFAPTVLPTSCDAVDCFTTPDLSLYSLQNPPFVPPVPPPTPPEMPPSVCAFKNQATVISLVGYCVFAGRPNPTLIDPAYVPPFWITLQTQTVGGKLTITSMTVMAGTFCGNTQASANALATTILNNLIAYLKNVGTIHC